MYSAILRQFDTLTLQQLDAANLLMKNRFEAKFFFSTSLLEKLLSACLLNYRILKIADNRIFNYYNRYFDTPAYQLYYQHHNGRAGRFKIRNRKYLDSQLSFIEIKQKTRKGISLKYRREADSLSAASDLLKEHTNVDYNMLLPMLENRYSRITLLHKVNTEKVTIDLNLNFESEENKISFSNIVIAEVKSENYSGTEFASIMKSFGIKEGGMSKYCMGMIALNKDVRHNVFNESYKQIVKKNTDGTK